jgi:hypothetical protein
MTTKTNPKLYIIPLHDLASTGLTEIETELCKMIVQSAAEDEELNTDISNLDRFHTNQPTSDHHMICECCTYPEKIDSTRMIDLVGLTPICRACASLITCKRYEKCESTDCAYCEILRHTMWPSRATHAAIGSTALRPYFSDVLKECLPKQLRDFDTDDEDVLVL